MRSRRNGSGRPLAGRVVVVTGGARGIGRAIVTGMANRGCKVAVGDLDAEAAGQAIAGLDDDALAAGLDVTDRVSFEGFLAQVEERLGPVDVVVNNAGVMLLNELVEESDEAAARMIDVNLRGVLLGTKLAMERMVPRGTGSIVNVASLAGKVGFPGAATYCATKHGVVGLSEAARAELRGTGVGISCVMPTVVNTELGGGLRKARGLPTLEAGDVAEKVVEAVQRGRFEVWVPRYSRALIVGGQLLPRGFSEAIGRLMRVDRVLADADREARSAYERRARS